MLLFDHSMIQSLFLQEKGKRCDSSETIQYLSSKKNFFFDVNAIIATIPESQHL